MEIVGLKVSSKSGKPVYRVRCDKCGRVFETTDAYKFVKCPCGNHMRLVDLLAQF